MRQPQIVCCPPQGAAVPGPRKGTAREGGSSRWNPAHTTASAGNPAAIQVASQARVTPAAMQTNSWWLATPLQAVLDDSLQRTHCVFCTNAVINADGAEKV